MRENGSCKLLPNPASGWDLTWGQLHPTPLPVPMKVPVTGPVQGVMAATSVGNQQAAVGRGQPCLDVSGLCRAESGSLRGQLDIVEESEGG